MQSSYVLRADSSEGFMEFDYIVVGAGAAGCVVAARLSQRPTLRVLLIEAGADIVPEPHSVSSPYPISHGVPSFRWPNMFATVKAPLRDGVQAPPAPFPQARIVGGGGSLMGMFALRGVPADYDDWCDSGATGWSWRDVLASFRRLERDHDFGGDAHGGDGPIPIRRHAREDWSPFARAVGDAFEADGFPFIADANADFRDGHLAMPSSNLPHRRVSSATGFLDARTRARPNLTIVTNAEVQRILIEGKQAKGVAVSMPQGSVSYKSRNVIICAGTLKSPQLLLQSGVGPASELLQLGITPVHDSPGVGRNLSNHPIIYLSAFVPRKYRKRHGPAIFNALRYSSGHADCPSHDMLMPLLNRTAWHTLGDSVSLLGVSVYKPASRGRVWLSRKNGAIEPNIDLAFFSDPRDLARLTDGFKLVFRYLTQAQRALSGLKIFAPTDTKLMTKLAEPSLSHAAISWLVAKMMDGPTQQRVLQKAGADPRTLVTDEERLREFVYRHSSPMFHPAGTCRIGAASDPDAVVDPRCRVIGVEGLCVADASVMPSIVRANTNIPTLMIAEKAAAMFLEDYDSTGTGT